VCGNEGRCSFKDDQCLVTKDADCKQSKACTVDGRCKAKPRTAKEKDTCTACYGLCVR
jgi:hypothetical protein